MKSKTITALLVVIIIIQFDDLRHPGVLDYVKTALLAIAVVLNLIDTFTGEKHAN